MQLFAWRGSCGSLFCLVPWWLMSHSQPTPFSSALSWHHWQHTWAFATLSTLRKGPALEHTQPCARCKTLQVKCRLDFSTFCPHSQGPVRPETIPAAPAVGIPSSSGSPNGRMSILRVQADTVRSYAGTTGINWVSPKQDGTEDSKTHVECHWRRLKPSYLPQGCLTNGRLTLYGGRAVAPTLFVSALPLVFFSPAQLAQANPHVHSMSMARGRRMASLMGSTSMEERSLRLVLLKPNEGVLRG